MILNHNFLQYDIPSELGSLTKLRELLLEQNAFRDDIPSELGKLTGLRKNYQNCMYFCFGLSLSVIFLFQIYCESSTRNYKGRCQVKSVN